MKNLLLYSLGGFLLLTSCFKEKNEDLVLENHQGDWAAQIINSEFSMTDIIDQAGNNTNNNLALEIVDDNIVLTYTNTQESSLPSDYYKMQDQEAPAEYVYDEISLPGNIANGLDFGPEVLDVSYVIPNLPLDFNNTTIPDAQLKEILVKTGTFNLDFINSFGHSLTVTLDIPSIVQDDGQTLALTVDVPAYGNISREINIDGYTIDLVNDQTGDFNYFSATATLSGTLGNAPITTGDKITMISKIKNVEYDHIVGRLGTFTIDLPEGINSISLFENLDEETEVNIETFEIKTTIETNWGLPVSAKVNQLEFYNTVTNEDPVIITDLEPLEINALSNLSDVDSKLEQDEIIYNSETYPELTNILPLKPTEFVYNVALTANPENTLDEDMFISSKSKVFATTEGRFQLHGYLKNYESTDTIDIDLTVDQDLTQFDESSIRIILDNGVPLGYIMDLYVLDENDNILVEKIDQVKVDGADVDQDGYSTNMKHNKTDLVFNSSELEEITSKGQKIVLVSKVNTTDANKEQNVHIRASDKMKAIIGVRVNVNVDLN